MRLFNSFAAKLKNVVWDYTFTINILKSFRKQTIK